MQERDKRTDRAGGAPQAAAAPRKAPRSAGGGGRPPAPRAARAAAPGSTGWRAALPRDAAGWADALVFAGVLGLIVVTPWFRGLFFPMEQMVALLVALALFAARWWAKFSRDDYAFLRGPLDWAAFGLWLAYVASTFVAANVRAALQEDMKYLLYFLVYWLVRELARDERRRAMVLGAVAVAGAWVAVLGVGAAAGTFHFPGAFEAPRIYSAFQYPNTTAAYLTAAFACAVALWVRAAAPAWLPAAVPGQAAAPRQASARVPALVAGERGGVAVAAWAPLARSWPALLWAVAAYVILFCFVFTFSRGAWVLFPLVAALLIAALPKGYRLGSLLLTAVLIAAFAPWARAFLAAVNAKAAAAAWRAFLLGVPLAAVGHLVVLALMRLPPRVRGLALGAAACGGAILISVAGRRLLPGGFFLERLRSISPETLSARERIAWITDALKIVRDHPVLGAGGGGWDALYHQYQNYGYYSTQVHGHYAQVWVETGTVGLIALLAIWVFVLRQGWRLLRGWAIQEGGAVPAAIGSPAGARVVALAGLVAALALGLHSAIDFNLSLAAVSVALWALFGVVEAGASAAGGGPRRDAGATGNAYRLLPRLAAYGLTVLAATGTASLLAGFVIGQRAVRALNAGRATEAQALYERAVAYDPFTASFHIDLGQIYEARALQGGDGSLIGRAQREFRRGLRLEPYNANFHALYGVLLLRSGQPDEGIAEMERSLQLNPYEIRRYETLADALMQVGLQHAVRGQREKALPLMDQALALQGRLARQRAVIPAWVPDYLRLSASTPHLALRWGEALAAKGDLAGAEQQLRSATELREPPFQAEARLWLSQVLARLGKREEADTELRKAKELDGRVSQQVEAVSRLVAAVSP